MKHEEEKFNNLYRLYAKDVYRFAYRLCQNTDEAKDITSETFVRVWLSDNETRLDTVKAYLFTIAKNYFLQQRLKNNRSTSLSIKNAGTTEDSLHAVEILSELEHTLHAVNKLAEQDKTLIMLRAEKDLTYEEIAAITGLSISAVKVRLFRIRIKLALHKTKQ